MRHVVAAGVLLACMGTAAEAQVSTRGSAAAIPPVTQDAPTGREPAATGTIAPTGRVKPPGSPLGTPSERESELDRRQQELDRRIRTGICRGC